MEWQQRGFSHESSRKSIIWQTASASTCKCCGWTSCPAADTTVYSLYTDTCRCQGWGVDSVDTVQHIHSRTAPHPIADLWDTTYRHLDLHTGIHLMKTERERIRYSHSHASFLIVLNVWHVAHMVAHTPPVWDQIFINLNKIFCKISEAFLTGFVVQFPAWATAVFGESISTDTLASRFIHNPVGTTESQKTWVQHIWMQHERRAKLVNSGQF